jgi:hypothetical protein
VADGDGELELGESLGDAGGLLLCPGDAEVDGAWDLDGGHVPDFAGVRFEPSELIGDEPTALVPPGPPWEPSPVPVPPFVEPGAFELLGKIACCASMAT